MFEENKNHSEIRIEDSSKLIEEVHSIEKEAMLKIIESDELLYIACPNVEMDYMMTLGHLDIQAFELQLEYMTLQRKLRLIQETEEQKQKPDLKKIAQSVYHEFKDYYDQLDHLYLQKHKADARKKAETLSKEDTRRVKKLYAGILKRVHPAFRVCDDKDGNILYEKAVEAFRFGNLNRLEYLYQLAEEICPYPNLDDFSITQLKSREEKLIASLVKTEKQTAMLRSNPPLAYQSLLSKPYEIEKHKEHLEKRIQEYKQIIFDDQKRYDRYKKIYN